MGSYLSFNMGETLEELEGIVEEKNIFESHLIVTCAALRKKKLCHFTVEDLRIMIKQQQGLEYLVPIALEILEENPLVKGDYYSGDLLEAVMNISNEFWEEHMAYKEALRVIIKEKVEYFKELLNKL